MSKPCANCSMPIAEKADFCDGCGTPVCAPVPQPESASEFARTQKKCTRYWISVIAAIVAAVVVAAIFVPWGDLFGGKPSGSKASGYESAIDLMVSNIVMCKADNVESMAPAAFWDMLEDKQDICVQDITSSMEETFEEADAYYAQKYGNDYKIVYKILDAKDASGDEIAAINEATEYGEVTEAVFLKLEISVAGERNGNSDPEEMAVIKIDGNWYPVHIDAASENHLRVTFYVDDLTFYIGYVERTVEEGFAS